MAKSTIGYKVSFWVDKDGRPVKSLGMGAHTVTGELVLSKPGIEDGYYLGWKDSPVVVSEWLVNAIPYDNLEYVDRHPNLYAFKHFLHASRFLVEQIHVPMHVKQIDSTKTPPKAEKKAEKTMGIDLVSKKGIQKPLANAKRYTVDATWRQAVDQAVDLAHERLTRALEKTAFSFLPLEAADALLKSELGKRLLAYTVGFALEANKVSDDPRVARLASELQIYGMEYFAGKVIKQLKGLAKEILPDLPEVEAVASASAGAPGVQ